MAEDFASMTAVDLASISLDYEGFRSLAQNPHLSQNQKIGFPDDYRDGFDTKIFHDICTKLPLLRSRDKTVLDIGPGCAPLARHIIDCCEANNHRLILCDSREMLDQLPDRPGNLKIAGPFPTTLNQVRSAANGAADVVICYSVLHYLFVDFNPFDVIDAIVSILAPGGAALIGDIPNVSKRKRFFASDAGKEFHKEFMNTSEAPVVHFNSLERGKIDDSVIAGLMQRAQLAGCDAYLLPQAVDLPMANRRDDLLLLRS